MRCRTVNLLFHRDRAPAPPAASVFFSAARRRTPAKARFYRPKGSCFRQPPLTHALGFVLSVRLTVPRFLPLSGTDATMAPTLLVWLLRSIADDSTVRRHSHYRHYPCARGAFCCLSTRRAGSGRNQGRTSGGARSEPGGRH